MGGGEREAGVTGRARLRALPLPLPRPRRSPRTTLAAALACVLLAATACSPDSPGEDLPTRADLTAGDVITRMPMDSPGPGATRIVYASESVAGRGAVVSGVLLEPEGPWRGPGRRPIAVIAPGTQGAADYCSMSMTMHFGQDAPPPADFFLSRGWGVAITDYEGLGTPGRHTYLVREAQGKAVLDVARAAANEWGAGPVVMFGFSQGGAATAAAAELADAYAPELDVRAVYAGGVPEDLAGTAAHIDGSALAGAMGYAIGGLVAAYPGVAGEVDALLSEEGRRFVESTSGECVGDTVRNWRGRDSRDFTADGRTLAEALESSGQLRDVVAEQRLGGVAPSMPVFVAHNSFDDVIPVEGARELVRRWCGAGADVTYVEVAEDFGDGSHALGFQLTTGDAMEWLDRVLDGTHRPGC